MPDDLAATLRRAVLAVLGARPGATRLRAVAEVLDTRLSHNIPGTYLHTP